MCACVRVCSVCASACVAAYTIKLFVALSSALLQFVLDISGRRLVGLVARPLAVHERAHVTFAHAADA